MSLPAGWVRILEAEEPSLEILKLWTPFRVRMGRTMAAMATRLRRVTLHTLPDGTPALHYHFQRGETPLIYQGNPPGPPPAHVPKDVAEFYALHDGWATLQGRSEGLLSSSEGYPLNKLFIVSDLLGGICALGFDVQTGVCWKWWKDLPPEMVIDFWATLDRCVADYLEQQDRVR